MVEILVALAMISLGYVAIYSLQLVALNGNSGSQDISRATNLAERWVEILRLKSLAWTESAGLPSELATYDTWLTTRTEMVNKDNLSSTDSTAITDTKYCVWYRVSPAPNGVSDPSILRLDVRVAWPRADSDWTAYTSCGVEMFDADNLPYVREITMTTTLYRHGT